MNDVAKALNSVKGKIALALQQQYQSLSHHSVRLVAVSKFKTPEVISEAFAAGQLDFGENYVQELCEKAPQLPAAIRWHFIGHLQSNKVKQLLLSVPNLHCIETIDSEKLASRVDKTLAALFPPSAASGAEGRQLGVLVQVNTSGEQQKGGVLPSQAPALAKYITESCPRLKFMGLMTIGSAQVSLGNAESAQVSLSTTTTTGNEQVLSSTTGNEQMLSSTTGNEQVVSTGSNHTSIESAQVSLSVTTGNEQILSTGHLSEPSVLPEHSDFSCLVRTRSDVCAMLKLPESDVQLSMGMSADYELAVKYGATSVRVGSLIFGTR